MNSTRRVVNDYQTVSMSRIFMQESFGIPITANVPACKNLIQRVQHHIISEEEFMSIVTEAEKGHYLVASKILHTLLENKAKAKRRNGRQSTPVYINCTICNKEFRRQNIRIKNCSSKCSAEYRRAKHREEYTKVSFDDKACKECNSVFQPSSRRHMFCSRICGSNYRYKVGKS